MAAGIWFFVRHGTAQQPDEADLVSPMALHQQSTQQMMGVRIRRILFYGVFIQSFSLFHVAILVHVLSLNIHTQAVKKKEL